MENEQEIYQASSDELRLLYNEIDRLSCNQYDFINKLAKLQGLAEKISNFNFPKCKKKLSNDQATEITVKILELIKSDIKSDEMNISPNKVKNFMENYYETNNIFNPIIFNIYKNGWKSFNLNRSINSFINDLVVDISNNKI